MRKPCGNANFSNVALTGVNGESFTVATATADSKNVTASKFINAGSITGNAGVLTSNNNDLVIANLTEGNNVAAISKAALAVTKIYDGLLSATGIGTVGTLAGAGETVNSAGS